jgi:hypothetical protein
MESKNLDDKVLDKSISENENTQYSDNSVHKSLIFIQRILKNFAYVIAFLSTVTLMLGFGVAFEAESRFSLPHSSLYDSVLDLIDLGSSIAIIQLVTSLTNKVFCHEIVQTYKLMWRDLLVFFSALSLVVGLLLINKSHEP